MEKLERHIKEKLEARRLAPSNQAWDQIADQLKETTPQQPFRTTFRWALVAAVAVLIIGVGGYFVTQTKDAKNTQGFPVLVDKEQKIPAPMVNTPSNNTVAEVEKSIIVQDKVIEEHSLQKPPLVSNTAVVAATEDSLETANETVVLNDLSDARVAEKLDQVLQVVTAMERSQDPVTDAEIDSLLWAAQKELLAERLVQQDGKVDAMALLNEVELELYDQQRNPLFIKLKEGFFKLRTAVAYRNN
ncbi:MAG: hypothetical protein AAGF77_06340 [Bacteroidota bacterium]